MEAQSEAISTELLFRPSKRQKSYRQRAGESQDDDDGPVARDTAPEVLTSVLPGARRQDVEERDGEAETEAAGFSMADILRMRKLARTRKAGIEFTNKGSNSHAQRSQVDGTIQTLSMADAIEREVDKDTESPEALATVANRFAPQTGQVSTDVNKHMMEYIETELAKRRREDHADTFLDADQDNEEEEEDDEGSEDDDDEGAKSGVGSRLKQKKAAGSGAAAHRRLPPRQPAALGRLHEIDLGPDATLRNIARTEAATRQLGGGEEAADIEEGTDKARPRGKKKKGSRPWKKRRTSEDIKRDKLVEEVLRESRLEIYDDPEPLNNAQDDEQAADDRIAEQFRRDFMDAVSSRQRRRAVPASNSTATKGAKKDERPKGPKLGGSRSARAAMRELQEKAKR